MATAADILGVHRNGKIPARWSKHYLRLCAERDRLSARDCCAPGTSPSKLDDLTDAASDESEANLSLVAVSATKDAIFEVLAAIRRIECGTLWICELTGKPIQADRLKVIPWARYSLQSQSELEKAGRCESAACPNWDR